MKNDELLIFLKRYIFLITFEARPHLIPNFTKEMPFMHQELNEDDNLWGRFKKGNDHAFYLLYDQYADNLYKYGCHFSKDKDFIKDCIHDLFLELYRYRERLSETDNVQFYLFRSLRRIINKKRIKLIPVAYDEMSSSPNNMQDLSCEDSIIASETEAENRGILIEAMKTLSKRQHEALSLKFEYNQPYHKIAEIMDISVESARTMIYRALKELRKCIEHKAHSIQLLFFLANHLYS